MKLEDVVAWLEHEFGLDSAARVEVLPQADPETGERVPLPIRDISVDDSDEEVHLLVNASPWDEAEPKPPMNVSILLNRLKALVGSESYRVVSGRWQEIDEDHVGRIDWPLDGIATNDDDTAVAFVEHVFDNDSG